MQNEAIQPYLRRGNGLPTRTHHIVESIMKNNCFHYELKMPEDARSPTRFEDEEYEAYCADHQIVTQNTIDAGPGSYYKQRTAEAKKAVLPPLDMLMQLKLHNLPGIQAGFVAAGQGEERKAVLMLGGIACAACVWLIERQFLRLDGMVRANLNYSTHRARMV